MVVGGLKQPWNKLQGQANWEASFFCITETQGFFSFLPVLLFKWIPHRQLVGSYEMRRLHLAPAALQIVPVKLNLQGQHQREQQKNKELLKRCICLYYINNLSLRISKNCQRTLAVNITFNKSSAWNLSYLQNQLFFGKLLYYTLLMQNKPSPADLQVLLLCTYL